jgi:hypothetical protein
VQSLKLVKPVKPLKPFVMMGDQAATGALDFSYLLDGPAGKHGFVTVQDGHFVFEDGHRIRFFGANLTFEAALPDHETAVLLADRMAHGGFNMVRLHHVDSYQVGARTHTIIDYSRGNSQTLHAENLDRLDFLISLLRERGIYLHLDMFTLHRYLSGDQLDYEDSVATALKHVNWYNRRIIDLHKAFMAQYITHRNPYTGLRYVDDPAIAVVQLLNENSIFWETGDVPLPSYKRELDARWNQWLLDAYGSRDGLNQAWTKDDGAQALQPEEDPREGTVRRPTVGRWGERTVDARTAYDNVAGPARFADHVRFLTEIERSYIQELTTDLRDLGVKCPINVSNLPSGAADLRCVAEGDVTENNCYWNHPMGGFEVPVAFHDQEMVTSDPRQRTTHPFARNMLSKLAMGRVVGKPFVVTEWNVCYPTRFRADVPLMPPSHAALQDWDGLLLFCYFHRTGRELVESRQMRSFFNSYNDPGVWGLAGLASAIFQEKLVRPAQHRIEVAYTPLDTESTPPEVGMPFGVAPFIAEVAARFTGEAPYAGQADVVLSSGFTSTGDYTTAPHALVYARSPYQDRYQKEDGHAAWLARHEPSGAAETLRNSEGEAIGRLGDQMAVVHDGRAFDRDLSTFGQVLETCLSHWGLLEPGRGYDDARSALISDTGELAFRFGQGQFVVDTDRVAAFAGVVGQDPIVVGDVVMRLQNHKAAVAVLSRTDEPIRASRHLLITAVGESVNSGMVWDGPVLVDEGHGPILIDAIEGDVFIPSALSSCHAYGLDPSGRRADALRVTEGPGGFWIQLEHAAGAIHYEVVLD